MEDKVKNPESFFKKIFNEIVNYLFVILEFIFDYLGISFVILLLLFLTLLVFYPFILYISITYKSFDILQPYFIMPFFYLCSFILAVWLFKKADNFLKDMRIRAIGKLFDKGKYEEVLKIIENESLFKAPYEFEDYQRLLVFVKYQVESLAQTGRIKEAVTLMADEISNIYYVRMDFPEDLLEKWYELYDSCDPIPLDEFHYCPCWGGLNPVTWALLQKTIKKGYKPPLGYYSVVGVN